MKLKMKNSKVLNMILLGAYLEKRTVVKIDSIIEALKQVLPERYHKLLPLNRQALEAGAELVKSNKVEVH